MIKEIKKKQTKFGTIIGFADNADQVSNIEGHKAISAFAIAHAVGGASSDNVNGFRVVGHRNSPKFKNIIGNYISQIRGGELVVFLKPDVKILSDATAIYEYLDNHRIERAYAFWLGSAESPSAIVLSSVLMEHLFHATPDQLSADGDWTGFMDSWLKKSLTGGRYFDGNALVSLAVKEKIPASEYRIEEVKLVINDDAIMQAGAEAKAILEVNQDRIAQGFPDSNLISVKLKPGRPKTKK